MSRETLDEGKVIAYDSTLGRGRTNPTAPVARGKTTRSLPFAELSYDELRAALRTARGKSARGAATDPPLVKAVRARLAKARLGHIGVRLRQKKLDLTGIAPEHLTVLCKALLGVKLPT